MSNDTMYNVLIVGVGGQGVVLASNILCAVATEAGYDVKKSEIHGMSQRGGSVNSDVRFGDDVASPMVPAGEADFLVVLTEDQVDVNRQALKEGGVLLSETLVDAQDLPHPRSLNVAMLGALSVHLDLPEDAWHEAIRANLPEKVHAVNADAFALGRRRAADVG